jgi:hypothetical protein
MTRYPLLDSFGIEIESEGIIPGNLPRDLRNFFSETHDASIETPNVRVNPDNRMQIFEDPEQILPDFLMSTAGTEFVSRVLNIQTPEDKRAIYKLCGWMCSSGELEQSDRAGIHVHISMGYDQRILLNLTRLTSYLEQVFYYIGGMGYKHRGLKNDFTYCRPITEFGPSVIRANKYYQVFTVPGLLKTKTEREFFDAYGGINIENPPGKYYPVRYNWFTFFPLLSKGTVEFRVFNKTLNPQYIWSIIHLSRKVCEVALHPSEDLNLLPINSIYHKHNKDDVFKALVNFSRMSNLDTEILRSLLDILERVPEIHPTNQYVFTHLPVDRFSISYRYTEPYYIHTRDVKEPYFVDSHRLARENGTDTNTNRFRNSLLTPIPVTLRNVNRLDFVNTMDIIVDEDPDEDSDETSEDTTENSNW